MAESSPDAADLLVPVEARPARPVANPEVGARLPCRFLSVPSLSSDSALPEAVPDDRSGLGFMI
jgi:hypothetical protein